MVRDVHHASVAGYESEVADVAGGHHVDGVLDVPAVACNNCHGTGGVSVGHSMPSISGLSSFTKNPRPASRALVSSSSS